MFGFDITIVGKFGKCQDVKEYLYDVYNDALSAEVEG